MYIIIFLVYLFTLYNRVYVAATATRKWGPHRIDIYVDASYWRIQRMKFVYYDVNNDNKDNIRLYVRLTVILNCSYNDHIYTDRVICQYDESIPYQS